MTLPHAIPSILDYPLYWRQQAYALAVHSRLISRGVCCALLLLHHRYSFNDTEEYRNCCPEDNVERSRSTQNATFLVFPLQLWFCQFWCVNLVHWCMYVLDICMKLSFVCVCIADAVPTEKSVTTRTKSNAQGQCRMPNCWFWRCHSRRWIFCVTVTAVCKSWCAGNEQEWETKCTWSGRCDGCSDCLG